MKKMPMEPDADDRKRKSKPPMGARGAPAVPAARFRPKMPMKSPC